MNEILEMARNIQDALGMTDIIKYLSRWDEADFELGMLPELWSSHKNWALSGFSSMSTAAKGLKSVLYLSLRQIFLCTISCMQFHASYEKPKTHS